MIGALSENQQQALGDIIFWYREGNNHSSVPLSDYEHGCAVVSTAILADAAGLTQEQIDWAKAVGSVLGNNDFCKNPQLRF